MKSYVCSMDLNLYIIRHFFHDLLLFIFIFYNSLLQITRGQRSKSWTEVLRSFEFVNLYNNNNIIILNISFSREDTQEYSVTT